MVAREQTPLILAIETSGETGGVALFRERVLGEVRLSGAGTYSRRLLPAVDFLLRHLDLSLKDISALAVSIGPGSFTGLRIGLATVKALALALEVPVVAVESLAALAAQAMLSERPICPVLDARRGELYAALYRFQGEELLTLMPPTILTPEALGDRISEPVLFLGEGLRLHAQRLREVMGNRYLEAPSHLREAQPGALAWLAAMKARRGEFADPASLVPLYLRASEAERKRGWQVV